MRIRQFAVATLAAVVLVVASIAGARADDDLAAAYQTVRPALVFIKTDKGTGSGFIVASDATQSYIVTAAHVVAGTHKVSVYVANNINLALEPRVVKTDTDDDLALLRIAKGNLPTVAIGAVPSEGSAIGAAGYPPDSIKFLESSHELEPQVSGGIVSSVRNGGTIVQHNAATEPGDSGGPLFAVKSSSVVGVVRGKLAGSTSGYVATSSVPLQSFLAAADIHVAAAPAAPAAGAVASVDRSAGATNPQPIQDAPAAHVLCAVANAHAGEKTLNAPLFANAFATARDRIASTLGMRVVEHDDIDTKNWSTVAAGARANGCVGILAGLYRVGKNPDGGTTISVGYWLNDTRGNNYVVARRERKTGSVLLTALIVQPSFTALSQQAADDVLAVVAAHGDGAADNFARYGVLMGNQERDAFIRLIDTGNKVVKAYVYTFGTAARAGVRLGDVVTSFNGQAVSGLSQAELGALVSHATPPYDVAVVGADGRETHVRFVPQTLQWYLENRGARFFP